MIYHGVRHTAAGCLYRLGLALFELEKPDICIARDDSWIVGPEAPYEREGDVGNVTFPCGLTIGADGDTISLMDTRTKQLLEVRSVSPHSTAARGGFNAQGNPWFGGRGGALLKLDVKARQIREYFPPTPHVTFYEAMPDKRGEVWAGELHGGRMLRFNPQADHWTEYVLPEPYSHDRRTWIDNSTTPVTQGAIVSTGGLTVSIADATDAADGVLVTVGSGAATARATISACGVTLRLSPGSSAVITCGSVIVRTLSGSVQAVLDNGLIVVTIPAGSSARVSDTATGAQVTQVVGTGVTATVNGQTSSLAPGAAAVTLASWSVPGFSAPVDNQPVLNSTKAGRAVPLKWHVTNAANAPVTTLTTATVTVQNLSCGLAVTTDELEETFAGGSGLQNLGNGDYQLNWKTPSTYAGSCKTMVLDLGGGVTARADFRFTK